jgi:hypothetical protein
MDSSPSIACYACTNPYNPQADRSLRWNDPELAIEWPIEIGLDPIVPPKTPPRQPSPIAKSMTYPAPAGSEFSVFGRQLSWSATGRGHMLPFEVISR